MLNSSFFPFSPQCYMRSSQIHLLTTSITFLFHLGWFVNLPFGISSMTDIVALQILSSNFLDAQNLSSRFILCFSLTYTRNGGEKIKTLVRFESRALCVESDESANA